VLCEVQRVMGHLGFLFLRFGKARQKVKLVIAKLTISVGQGRPLASGSSIHGRLKIGRKQDFLLSVKVFVNSLKSKLV
jgi:hypothetical protein